MKKLALISSSDLKYYGGGEKDIIGLANMLCNSYNITLFYPEGKENLRVNIDYIKKILNKKIKLSEYKCFELNSSKDFVPLNLKGIKFLLSLKKFNVIYSMSQSIILNTFILHVSKHWDVRFIFGIHTPYFFRTEPIKPNFFKKYAIRYYSNLRSHFITNLENIRIQNSTDEELLKQFGYSGKIYNIPPHIFDKEPEKVFTNKKEFIVLFVGRLSIEQKGIDLLKNIIESTLQKSNRIKFYIVGSGEDGENIVKTLVAKYRNNVKWFGFVSDKELKSLYNKSSLFIFPSRGENFGISLGEAQTYGLPAVAYNVMGSKDILNKNFLGALIKPFNIDKFANKIIEYYFIWKKNPSQYKYLKNKIKNYTVYMYNNTAFIKEMKKML